MRQNFNIKIRKQRISHATEEDVFEKCGENSSKYFSAFHLVGNQENFTSNLQLLSIQD